MGYLLDIEKYLSIKLDKILYFYIIISTYLFWVRPRSEFFGNILNNSTLFGVGLENVSCESVWEELERFQMTISSATSFEIGHWEFGV